MRAIASPQTLGQAVEAAGAERRVELQPPIHRVHAESVIRACEHDAPHLVPARSFVDLVQRAQVVLDDLGQRALDAGAGHVDQHVDAGEQLVDYCRVAQVALHQVLAVEHRRERARTPGRAEVDSALAQTPAKNAADDAAGAAQSHFGHWVTSKGRICRRRQPLQWA